MSTNWQVAGTIFWLFDISAKGASRGSGTLATPTVAPFDENACAPTSAPARVSALSRLLLPALARPTMPSCSMYVAMVPSLPRRLAPLVLIAGVAAILRIAALGSPNEIYFDETYYANDARVYLDGLSAYNRPLDFDATAPPSQPPPSLGVRGEKSWVHPPLGKWVIALGEAIVGTESPWGRRIVPALFGIGTVVLVYLIALELTAQSIVWASLAAGFAALDGLLIVESRISVLDPILTGFVCLGAWCLLRDRDSIDGRSWYGSRWRIGAGCAFGAAVATKWSGLLALLPALALAVACTVSDR